MCIRLIIFLVMCLAMLIAGAQEPIDTAATQQLDEIVIEAPRVIRKADMDVYYPSQSAVEKSKNGLQLLRNLMIPMLTVTEALGTVQAAGESVQVCINGREATVDQVRDLLPETIKRVEWLDNPGLRYKGAHYVLNFIVSNPAAGGSLQSEAEPALNTSWGYIWGSLKLNNGPSQWSVGANFRLSNKMKSHRDYTETFNFPDGQSLTRRETPISGRLGNTMGWPWITYSYTNPDTTVFYVCLEDYHTFRDYVDYTGRMTLSNGTPDVLLRDYSGSNGNTSRMSVYFEQHLSHKQTLVVDLQASLYYGKSYSDYRESENFEPWSYVPLAVVTDIHTLIRDRNQAYGVEADYIKNWAKSRLTAGISYSANRNRSTYENLGGRIFHQRQDKVYFFGEYFHRIGPVSLIGGLGAQYTDFMFRETHQGSHSWNLRPQATVAYSVNQSHQLRLSFESWQSATSLVETNVAPQQIDGIRWRVGNPSLKTSSSYKLTLRYNFTLPRIAGQFGIRAFTSPNAITPLLYWEGDRLINTYENSRGLRNLSFFIAPQIEIIPDWLMVSGYVQYRIENMRGTGYRLHNSNWSGSANVSISHWGFDLSAKYHRADRDLWGEQISWGEDLSIIDLSYNMKHWQFAVGMIMPFGRYDQGSRTISKWTTSEKHLRLDMRMPYIRLSYDVQWGRQKREARKLINADANVDSSTAGGK